MRCPNCDGTLVMDELEGTGEVQLICLDSNQMGCDYTEYRSSPPRDWPLFERTNTGSSAPVVTPCGQYHCEPMCGVCRREVGAY